MVPHVHREPAIVARLITAEVTEKGLVVLEGASAVPAAPLLGTHVVEGHRVNPLAAGRTDGVQFEAPRAKETAMAMGAQFGGGVSGMEGGKVRTVRLLATVTLESGTPMMFKVLGVVPFAAL